MRGIMRIDIMVDIETLGKEDKSTVIQIAACAFDIHTGIIYNKFNQSLNISEDKNISVQGDTLMWWLKTNKELLTSILENGNCSTEKELVLSFNDWIISLGDKMDIFFWGNGILFDNRIIKYKIEQYGQEYPIFYRNDRDMRTIVELAAIKSGYKNEKEFKDNNIISGLVAHDAFDDVIYQIAILSKAWNIIM